MSICESRTSTKMTKVNDTEKFRISHAEAKPPETIRDSNPEHEEDESVTSKIEFPMTEPKWDSREEPPNHLLYPAEKMVMMQTLSVKLKDELETLKDALRQHREAEQHSNAAKEALHKELQGLKKDNLVLNRQLEKEKDACGLLRNVTAQLSSSLETETKAVESLSREKDKLSTDLQREHHCRLQLCSELEEYKEAVRQKYHAEKSSAELEAKMIETLAKDKESLCAELQKERSWKLQLSEELQDYKDGLLRKFQGENSNTDSDAQQQMSESLQSELTRMSSRLETEMKIESWSTEKEVHQEHISKMQTAFREESSTVKSENLHQMFESLRGEVTRLSIKLEKEVKNKTTSQFGDSDVGADQLTHQEMKHLKRLKETREAGDVAEAKSEKVKNLKISNFLLSHQLSRQKEISENLEAENGRLSNRLETESKNNEELAKLREEDGSQLQQEKRWRVELQNQLQKQMFSHQQELETLQKSCTETQGLRHDLERLRSAHTELSKRFQNEEDLCRHFHILTQRLTSYLQMERRRNKCLSASLQKELTHKQNLSDITSEDKDVHLQVLEALKGAKSGNSRDDFGKWTRNVFGWRKKSKPRQEGPHSPCCEHPCTESSQRPSEPQMSTTQ